MASFDPMAGSQIDVDPALKPKMSKEAAARRQQLIERFMQAGATLEQATLEADRYMADYPTVTGLQPPAQAPAPTPSPPPSAQESMEADLYAKGYSADEARKQAQIQAEMQAEREREQLEQDLSQGGYGQRRVPSPRGLDGRSAQGAPFASVEEAENYSERAEATGMPGLYSPSQADDDMRARGFVPVYTPDGRVSYQLEAVDGSFVPGSPGRAGSRADLTAPRPDGKGGMMPGPYYRDSAEGPTGGQQVLRPTEATLAKRDAAYAKAKERQDARNPYKDMASPAERMKRFHAQIQLGGGHLSPQAIQLETMLNGMTPEQRQQAMRYMVPGGQFAAGVDAQNMQNANDVIKRFMTSGAANMQNNPLAQTQAQLAQQQVDAAKPVQVRAQEQVAAGNLNHPDVFSHADAIVHSQFSSRPGLLGISSDFTDNEVAIAAQTLADDTGMDIAEAEKIMRRIQAERRRNSVASSIIGGFYDQ